jgi:hypothetical protein
VQELPLDDCGVGDQLGAVAQEHVEPAERVLEVLVSEVAVEGGVEERVQVVELGRGEVGGMDD